MAYIATMHGQDLRVQIEELGGSRFRVNLGDRVYEVDYLEPMPELLSLLIDGRSFEVDVHPATKPEHFELAIEGETHTLELVEEKKKKLALKLARGAAGRQEIRSPMAGQIQAVLVSCGDRVRAGQPLLILEAMKMQNELTSPVNGVVASLSAKTGLSVAAQAALAVVEPEAHPDSQG